MSAINDIPPHHLQFMKKIVDTAIRTVINYFRLLSPPPPPPEIPRCPVTVYFSCLLKPSSCLSQQHDDSDDRAYMATRFVLKEEFR